MLLNDVQRNFKDSILDDPRGLDTLPDAFRKIFKEGEIPLSSRLKVYRNNFVGSLMAIMTDTFPIMHKLVGKEFFDMMAYRFILENPPKQGYLSLYGGGFDHFIENFELAKALPYLPDIARFEIALNESYYAPDDDILTAMDLAAIAPEELPGFTIKVRDNVRFVQSRFPLSLIRDFCQNPQGKLDIGKQGEKLMISRPDLKVTVTALDEAEWSALNFMVQKPITFEDLIINHPGIDFQKLLEKHLALATFTHLPSQTAQA